MNLTTGYNTQSSLVPAYPKDDNCAVCSTPLGDSINKPVVVTNTCSHYFHLECLANEFTGKDIGDRVCFSCQADPFPLKRPDGVQLHDKIYEESAYCESLPLEACRDGKLDVLGNQLSLHPDIVGKTFKTANSDSQITLLAAAAAAGRSDIIRKLVNANANVNATQSDNGRTALHFAADAGHTNAVNELLGAGADAKIAETKSEETPLHFASQNGHLDVVKLLIREWGKSGQHQTGVNRQANTTEPTCAVENKSSSPVLVKRLSKNFQRISLSGKDSTNNANSARDTALSKKPENRLLPDIDMTNIDGNTALHLAANKGHIAIAKLLLEAGADINKTDNDEETAVHLAASEGYTDMVKELASSGAVIDRINNNSHTPLHIAADGGHTTTVQTLIELGDTAFINNIDIEGDTAINIAAANGHKDTVIALINAGADTGIANNDGDIPIHSAAAEGHTDTVMALLVNGKTDIEITNNVDGGTALHLAAYYGRTDTVKALCTFNASLVNKIDFEGNTPLHIAAMNPDIAAMNPNIETIETIKTVVETLKALHNFGANPLAVNHSGETAYQLILELDIDIWKILSGVATAVSSPAFVMNP